MIGLLMDEGTFDLKTDGNGRLQVGVIDVQNQYSLLKFQKGAIKRLPDRCVGIDSYVESEDIAGMMREVRKQYTLDGMTVGSIGFEGNDLKIDAAYK